MSPTAVHRPQTAFIGREAELAALKQRIERGERLVTLLGPPGTGKTRTLRELGQRAGAKHVDAVVWCELAPARNREELLSVVASACGVNLRGGDDFDESVRRVGDALAERGPILLLLDNFEQVTSCAADTVGVWHAIAPETFFLSSSRHRLALHGERIFDLAPLVIDDAVALFDDRAKMVRRDFQIEQHRDDIVELVTQLDRLPLAIELAAARSATMTPADLLRRLDARFEILRTRERGVDDRQATMEAAIAWSWDLLDDLERRALCQLTVFRGGFTIEAAEMVVDAEDEWVPDLLDRLRAKSLLQTVESDGPARLAPYVSINAFASARAQDIVDIDASARRHATYFAALGERESQRMHRSGGHAAMRALERETPNLVEAFERTRTAQPETALTLAASLDDLLRFVGPSEQHERILGEALDIAHDAALADFPPARFLRARAELAIVRGNLDDALDDIDEALDTASDAERGRLLLRRGEAFRTRGKAADGAASLEAAFDVASRIDLRWLERSALAHLASCRVDLGDHESARDDLAQLQKLQRSDDLRQEAEVLKRVAYVQYYLGNFAEQRRNNEEALELAQEIGDRRLEGLCLQGVGDSAFAQGDFDEAVAFYERGLAIHRDLGNRHFEAMLLGNLGGAYHRSGSLPQARKSYARSLELHRSTGARPYEGVVSFALGALEHESGHADDAHFHYDRALDVARETAQASDEAALLLCKTWLDLEDPAVAPDALRDRVVLATTTFGDDDNWRAAAMATLAAVELFAGERANGSSTLAEARAAAEPDTVVAAIVDAIDFLYDVTADPDVDPRPEIAQFGDEDVYRRSLHARLAAQLVRNGWRRALGEANAEEFSEVEDVPTVTVGPDVRWFQFPQGERVDLRRRKALRLVLTHLIDLHEREPGTGSDVHDVFDHGWPDEEIHPDQAVERVYWAVRTLRKLGFESILLTSDEGYLLSPDLEVRDGE